MIAVRFTFSAAAAWHLVLNKRYFLTALTAFLRVRHSDALPCPRLFYVKVGVPFEEEAENQRRKKSVWPIPVGRYSVSIGGGPVRSAEPGFGDDAGRRRDGRRAFDSGAVYWSRHFV